MQRGDTVPVRRAQTPRDFDELRDLIAEYEQALPPRLRHIGLEDELSDLHGRYGSPNAAFLASVDETAAGCVALVSVDRSDAVVKRLYVRPRYRRLGIARALLDAVLEAARARAHRSVVLDTHREELPGAYHLYLSYGFRECEPLNTVEYACPTFMRLELGDTR